MASNDRQIQNWVFKILYSANLLIIAGLLAGGVYDRRGEIDAGSISVLGVLFLTAISQVILFWTSLLALNIWGIFLHRGYRVAFALISVMLAIFVSFAILVVIRLVTFGI